MHSVLPCRSWLPESALQTVAIEAMLGDVLRGWSRDWLVRNSLRPSTRLVRWDSTPLLVDHSTWFTVDDAVAISVSAGCRFELVQAMLDVSEADSPQSDADRRIVDGLARTALDNLMGRLSEFHREPSKRWTELPAGERPNLIDRWECTISFGVGATLFRFAISNEAVIAAIKGGLPEPKRKVPLSPVASALAAQTIEVSARLGSANVSLAELAGLSPGDVMVLETELTGPSALAIDGEARGDLSCAVERREGGYTLKLLQPLNG